MSSDDRRLKTTLPQVEDESMGKNKPGTGKDLDLSTQRRIGAHFHRIMSENGVRTVSDFADAAEIDKSRMGKILDGLGAPSLAVIVRICRKYREKCDFICNVDPEPGWFTMLDNHGSTDKRYKSHVHKKSTGTQQGSAMDRARRSWKRRFPRVPAPEMRAMVEGHAYEVVDMSLGGVGLKGNNLVPGQRVRVSLDNGPESQYEVVWADGKRAGLRLLP